MKLLALIMGFFVKRKTYQSHISEAVSEGIKDAFKEMGNCFHKSDKTA
jgi:hypothetical protein